MIAAAHRRVMVRVVVALAAMLTVILVVALVTVSMAGPAGSTALAFSGIVGGVLAGILVALRTALSGFDTAPPPLLIAKAAFACGSGAIGGAVVATVRTILPSSLLASTGTPHWTRPQAFLLGFLVGLGLALSGGTSGRLVIEETVLNRRSDG